eukprot:gene9145-10838_t
MVVISRTPTMSKADHNREIHTDDPQEVEIFRSVLDDLYRTKGPLYSTEAPVAIMLVPGAQPAGVARSTSSAHPQRQASTAGVQRQGSATGVLGETLPYARVVQLHPPNLATDLPLEVAWARFGGDAILIQEAALTGPPHHLLDLVWKVSQRRTFCPDGFAFSEGDAVKLQRALSIERDTLMFAGDEREAVPSWSLAQYSRHVVAVRGNELHEGLDKLNRSLATLRLENELAGLGSEHGQSRVSPRVEVGKSDYIVMDESVWTRGAAALFAIQGSREHSGDPSLLYEQPFQPDAGAVRQGLQGVTIMSAQIFERWTRSVKQTLMEATNDDGEDSPVFCDDALLPFPLHLRMIELSKDANVVEWDTTPLTNLWRNACGSYLDRLRAKVAECGELTVFESSSFSGFEEERIVFNEKFVPLLRRQAEQKGICLTFVDLRTGITSVQSGVEKQVVKICLDEAENADVFLGSYGARYGASTQEGPPGKWIMEHFDTCEQASDKYGWLKLVGLPDTAELPDTAGLPEITRMPDTAGRAGYRGAGRIPRGGPDTAGLPGTKGMDCFGHG